MFGMFAFWCIDAKQVGHFWLDGIPFPLVAALMEPLGVLKMSEGAQNFYKECIFFHANSGWWFQWTLRGANCRAPIGISWSLWVMMGHIAKLGPFFACEPDQVCRWSVILHALAYLPKKGGHRVADLRQIPKGSVIQNTVNARRWIDLSLRIRSVWIHVQF